MSHTFDALILRHCAKEIKEIIPGSYEDQQIDLTPFGKSHAQKIGRQHATPPYGYVEVTTSPYFKRTMRTVQKILEGAEYTGCYAYHCLSEEGLDEYFPKPPPVINGRWFSRGGLGIAHVDWMHRSLPPHELAVFPEKYISKLLLENYFPHPEKNVPCMATYAYAGLDAFISSVERNTARIDQGVPIFSVCCTHSPIIDVFSAAIFCTRRTIGYESVQVPTLVDFPGHYQFGEGIQVSIAYWHKDNPAFLWAAKGKNTLLWMDELKRKREQAFQDCRRFM